MLFLVAPEGAAAKKLSLATAFVGLAFLGVTLLIGPLRERRGRPNPLSTNLRRDIGIWAAIGGIVHTVVGLQVHMKGDVARYFLPGPADTGPVSKSMMAFLAANYTGLGATLLLVVLLAISNDLSLRALGAARWKRIQRFNYLLFALVAVHGALYVAVDKPAWVVTAAFAAIVVFISAAQISGRTARVKLLQWKGGKREDR